MIRIPGIIPITIHPVFWILCFGIGVLNSKSISQIFIWAFVILVSILVHEMGHALTGLAFRQKVQIDLVALGGMTSRRGPTLKLWQEFIIVAAGPFFGFMLAAFAYIGLGFFPHFALVLFVYVNLFWTVLNLLPVQPLDGGQLLRIIMESLFGVKGIRTSYLISIAVAATIGILAFIVMQIFIGAIMFLLAFESYRQWQGTAGMTIQDQDESLQKLMTEAERATRQGRFEEAEQKLEEIRKLSPHGMIHNSATLLLAQLLARREEYRQAYDMFKPVQKLIGDQGLPFYHQLAWKVEDFETLSSIANETYQLSPTYQTALINAFCAAQLQQVQPAIGWLKRAVSDGLPNLHQVLQRTEFDPIRRDPSFLEFQ